MCIRVLPKIAFKPARRFSMKHMTMTTRNVPFREPYEGVLFSQTKCEDAVAGVVPVDYKFRVLHERRELDDGKCWNTGRVLSSMLWSLT